MTARHAIGQFEENLRLFGDATSQPEKFNLYQGLGNLAVSLDSIERQNRQILDALNDIIRHMRRGT